MAILSMGSFLKTATQSSQDPSNPTLSLSLPEISVINPQNPSNPFAKDGNFVFYTNTTSTGYKFNASIWVYDVGNLYAYQAKLAFNFTVINATRAWVPTWDPEWVFYGKEAFPVISYGPDYKYEVTIGSTLLGEETPFDGTGVLGVIEFEITQGLAQPGKLLSNLTIDDEETFLIDIVGDDIPAAKINGYYEYVWFEPWLEVKPSKYVAVVIFRPFNVSVELNDVTSSDKLVSLEFKLRYNTTLLQVLTVSEGFFMKQFGNTIFTHQEVDDYVKVNITLTPSTEYPDGKGTLATITFQGIFQNDTEHASSLELFNIGLLGSDGEPLITSPSRNGSYIIRPIYSSLVEINLSSPSIVIYSNVTISGTIVANETKGGVDVTIYFRLPSNAWANLTKVQTDSRSNYNYTWTPPQPSTFELKANWTGDVSTKPAESDVEILTVTKIPSALTIAIDFTIVTVGENVTISGTLNPTRTGALITIYYKVAGGPWKILQTVDTADGYYVYDWKTENAGAYELYTVWSGDNVTFEALSPRVPLTVKKIPSSITIKVEPYVVTLGSNVSISGSIMPSKAQADVTIYYIEKNTTVQSTIRTRTNSTGHYNIVWQPTKNATFELYAWWKGDLNTHPNVSDLATLRVMAPSEVTINVDREIVPLGSTITISGTIRPNKASVNVTIYYRLNVTGEHWDILTTVQTNPFGNYTHAWTTTKAGVFELEAKWLGDNTYAPSKSDTIIVKVEEPLIILFYLPYILIGAAAVVIVLVLYFLKMRKQ